MSDRSGATAASTMVDRASAVGAKSVGEGTEAVIRPVARSIITWSGVKRGVNGSVLKGGVKRGVNGSVGEGTESEIRPVARSMMT